MLKPSTLLQRQFVATTSVLATLPFFLARLSGLGEGVTLPWIAQYQVPHALWRTPQEC
jgi:hypothetical protein